MQGFCSSGLLLNDMEYYDAAADQSLVIGSVGSYDVEIVSFDGRGSGSFAVVPLKMVTGVPTGQLV